MPRYLVERTFAEGLPSGPEMAALCRGAVERNADGAVTWLHSYVSDDRRKTFCVYDGPSPEAIRKAAARTNASTDHDGREDQQR